MTEPADDLYDFAPDTAPPPPTTKLPPTPIPEPGAPVLLAYRPKKDDKPKPLEAEQIKDVYLPLGLLGGGIIVQILAAIIWTHHVANTFAEIAVDLTAGTGVMLLAMWIAAKIRAIDLGKMHVAAYKLAAIFIAPQAVMQFISPITSFIPFGWIIALLIQFALFFALLGALFDLDESDTWYCVCIMFITRVALFFLLKAIWS
jgi:hypothetical protein